MADCFAEVISTLAAVASAIGGAFAARAAFRSAASAQDANAALAQAERRLAVRELVVAANEVMIELQRAESRAAELTRLYRELAIHCGQLGGSPQSKMIASIDARIASARAASSDTTELTKDVTTFYGASIDDINKRHAKVEQSLFQVRSIREDLEQEVASVEAQCAIHREAVIRGQ